MARARLAVPAAAAFWVNMQTAFDLWQAQRSLAVELAAIPTRAAV